RDGQPRGKRTRCARHDCVRSELQTAELSGDSVGIRIEPGVTATQAWRESLPVRGTEVVADITRANRDANLPRRNTVRQQHRYKRVVAADEIGAIREHDDPDRSDLPLVRLVREQPA